MWASRAANCTVNKSAVLFLSLQTLSVHWSVWLDFSSSPHHMNSQLNIEDLIRIRIYPNATYT